MARAPRAHRPPRPSGPRDSGRGSRWCAVRGVRRSTRKRGALHRRRPPAPARAPCAHGPRPARRQRRRRRRDPLSRRRGGHRDGEPAAAVCGRGRPGPDPPRDPQVAPNDGSGERALRPPPGRARRCGPRPPRLPGPRRRARHRHVEVAGGDPLPAGAPAPRGFHASPAAGFRSLRHLARLARDPASSRGARPQPGGRVVTVPNSAPGRPVRSRTVVLRHDED